ncbi:hypothetical protein [Okeania sp. SIO1I7]|uniref:hypothetical protein n=1 Tax=Okeania sp. SIO1I7 TaxID=2607772 RepID=UPI0013F8B90A|nr:hypothetical protein [Okeania sp. SIO1I7]NET26585.1 hypothetical protein [Okeania sp. SIO1I7]
MGRWEPTPDPSWEGNLGRWGIWGDGNPPLTPPGRGIWGDGNPPLTPPGRGIWGDGNQT